MALSIERYFFSGITKPPAASYFYFKVDNAYLSKVYDELQDEDEIIGKILAIKKPASPAIPYYEPINIPELEEKKENRFILRRNPDADWLYISLEDWHIIRDYGIIKEIYKIEAKLEYALTGIEKKRIDIYPKKDIDLREK